MRRAAGSFLGGASEQLLEAVAQTLRVVPAVAPPIEADHRSVLDQQMIGRDLGNGARGEAHHDNPALPGDRAQREIEHRPADRIVGDINAATVGQLADAVAQRRIFTTERMVGAVLAGDGELVSATGGRDHDRTHRLAALDGGQADAAAGAVNEQHLARTQISPPAQGAVRRAVRHREARGGDLVDVVRQCDHVLRQRHRLLGKAPWLTTASTLWPTARPRTPAPTASICPASSKPGVNGRFGFSW